MLADAVRTATGRWTPCGVSYSVNQQTWRRYRKHSEGMPTTTGSCAYGRDIKPPPPLGFRSAPAAIFTSSSDAVIPVSPKNDANVTWGPDSPEESLEEDTVAEVPGVGHCSTRNTRMVNFFTVTVGARRPDTRSGVASELKHLCYVSEAVTDHTLTPYTVALMPRSTTFGSRHHRQPAWPVF